MPACPPCSTDRDGNSKRGCWHCDSGITATSQASSDTSRSEPEKAFPTFRMGPALSGEGEADQGPYCPRPARPSYDRSDHGGCWGPGAQPWGILASLFRLSEDRWVAGLTGGQEPTAGQGATAVQGEHVPAHEEPYLAFWLPWCSRHLTAELSSGDPHPGGCAPGGVEWTGVPGVHVCPRPRQEPILEAAPPGRTEIPPRAPP